MLEAILVVHVNSYLLVTGYYQCKSQFKLNKLISLNNASWFYRVIILITLSLLQVIQVEKIDIIRGFFPLDSCAYWFIQMYLFLYCFSPFINQFIKCLTQKQFQMLLILCFIIFSILPSISMQMIINIDKGHSFMSVVFMYLLGAYFRYYPVQNLSFFKTNSKKKNQILFLSGFICCFLINFLFCCFGKFLMNGGEITKFLGETINLAFLSYGNPLVILGSLMYFFWFGTFVFKNKWINKVGKLTLGVYLIHDNPYTRVWLYPVLGFTEGKIYTGIIIIAKVFACAFLIFILCIILEWLRQLLFQKIK